MRSISLVPIFFYTFLFLSFSNCNSFPLLYSISQSTNVQKKKLARNKQILLNILKSRKKIFVVIGVMQTRLANGVRGNLTETQSLGGTPQFGAKI